ncbi:MAG: hypothetical protein EOM91_20275 [Sphingobacteriia bacterium]|nr:hypothetical protein [Sphingobacteriia bacterium]
MFNQRYPSAFRCALHASFISAAVLIGPAAIAQDQDDPIVLDYVTVAPVQIGERHLVMTVEPTQTRIRDTDREIVIDYARLELHRDDGHGTTPYVYRLNDPNAQPAPPAQPAPEGPPTSQPIHGVPIQEQLNASPAPPEAPAPVPQARRTDSTMAQALARYEITSESTDGPVRGFPVAMKTVWFGRGFLESRLTGSLVHTQWGRRFTEKRVQLWITREHSDYLPLATLAADREPILRANPLLAQLDWTLLIHELGGLPVRLEERGKDMVVRIELQPHPRGYAPTQAKPDETSATP